MSTYDDVSFHMLEYRYQWTTAEAASLLFFNPWTIFFWPFHLRRCHHGWISSGCDCARSTWFTSGWQLALGWQFPEFIAHCSDCDLVATLELTRGRSPRDLYRLLSNTGEVRKRRVSSNYGGRRKFCQLLAHVIDCGPWLSMRKLDAARPWRGRGSCRALFFAPAPSREFTSFNWENGCLTPGR